MADFTENVINQQFKKVYEYLESNNLIKGKSDIAKHLGTYNHVVNSILKGKRNITVDQLNKLFDIFSINANFIFGASGQMLNDGTDITTFSKEDRQTRKTNIKLVPNKALAGYAINHNDDSYVDSLQRFSLPGMEGDLLAFEISGNSMEPTITNGDIVVCEPLERGEPLRDNSVYVIVTDVVVAKRIQQHKRNNNLASISLISDNSAMYKPYQVDLNEIRQILKVKCRLTDYGMN